MSYTIPYTFVPGTKARAQEVNANFSSIIDAFDDLDSKKINLDLSNISADGIDVIKNNTVSRNVGEIFYTAFPLNDSGVHLLNGALLGAGGIYKDFVNYIKKLYNENPSASYFCTESQWQSSVSSYGVCGKFVYDSTNNTVRLPKVTGKIDGTTDLNVLGNLEPLFVKLPNIKGSLKFYSGYKVSQSGAITYTKHSGTNNLGGGDMLGECTLNIDASRSSSVYSGDNSNTEIHEQAVKMFVYIVIASSTKTDIQVDIDNIATDLNGKAGTDLTNVTDSAKVLMSGMSMPSNKYVDLTLGASGSTYTAPANGYISLRYNTTGTTCCCHLYDPSTGFGTTKFYTQSGLNGMIQNIEVRGGSTFAVLYAGVNVLMFRFIYAVGSKN